MRAWMGEKQRVTLVLMPSPERILTALSPSLMRGILTTILSASLARCLASFNMPSASVLTTSAFTGPSTMLQISLMSSSKSRPSLDTRLGLVVTPSSKPSSFAFVISSMFAVSIKNFIVPPSFLQSAFSTQLSACDLVS